MKKKIISVLLALTCALSLTACGGAGATTASSNQGADHLGVAYQFGLAYSPLIIAMDQGLIEKAYKEATGKDLVVEWNQIASGAEINTAMASGDIQAGFLGVGPAVTGVSKNVGYKVFTNLSGQEHGFMTNDASVNAFEDVIGSDKQISVVNIGSIQHIILAKALAEKGLDPHALDSNLVKMSHPDGMTAVQAGSIACHITANPYIYKEREDANLHEIENLPDTWGIDKSFIVGVAATSLHDDNIELYNALCKGISDAIDYMNNNLEDACKVTCEFNGNTLEDEVRFSKLGKYTKETHGLAELAKFMHDNDFIENDPGDYKNLAFDNVVGD